MSGQVVIKCVEVQQPIGLFYIGAINADDLVAISFSDTRRIEVENEIERYLGIQRPISPTRIKELGGYVNTVDASFPTSIILSISSEDVIFHKDTSTLEINNKPHTAKIIDGQHRIAGLKHFVGNGDQFQANVTIFIDMDIEDQAMVFTTINLKQEKVSKSLGYDLFEYASARSPQKTSHNIAKLLNYQKKSPFYGKIKILGKATQNGEQTLNQATFVEALISYISKEPIRDRDLLKRGKKISPATKDEITDLIFRNMFIAKEDASIAIIIDNYFTAISKKWPHAWNSSERGYILNKTIGFTSFMKILKPIFISKNKLGQVISVEDFEKTLEPIYMSDDDFVTENFAGTKGITKLTQRLLIDLGLDM
ncbi:DGQHR domain-containing protein [Paenibacillus sp. sptzw28]|uniref:DGQHR domain-containing protein n=1 Tax=Paenibacillus sp. sptzw28 TaxID=715179 RepID=UPI001C6E6164|nr:DGQHR domain-containing protein [Paenibacillus sp. sptzw28]QYR20980.1 DGQHR domain-containing protein [Paenibacillus sp. sptzw28]